MERTTFRHFTQVLLRHNAGAIGLNARAQRRYFYGNKVTISVEMVRTHRLSTAVNGLKEEKYNNLKGHD